MCLGMFILCTNMDFAGFISILSLLAQGKIWLARQRIIMSNHGNDKWFCRLIKCTSNFIFSMNKLCGNHFPYWCRSWNKTEAGVGLYSRWKVCMGKRKPIRWNYTVFSSWRYFCINQLSLGWVKRLISLSVCSH